MSVILYDYEKVNPTSWAYLSSLLMLALFFKFNRVFSVRNFDLFLLIALAPGVLLVQYSFENEGFRATEALVAQKLGFLWLFAGNPAPAGMRQLRDSRELLPNKAKFIGHHKNSGGRKRFNLDKFLR